jgi:Flp pilus assembly protein TadG
MTKQMLSPRRRPHQPAARRHRGGSHRTAQRGAELVEAALMLFLFFLLLFAIIEFGRAIWLSNAVAYGAQTAVRNAIVHGSNHATPATQASIRDEVVRAIPGLRNADVLITWPDGNNNPGSLVQTTVSLDLTLAIPGGPRFRTLRSQAESTIVGPPP